MDHTLWIHNCVYIETDTHVYQVHYISVPSTMYKRHPTHITQTILLLLNELDTICNQLPPSTLYYAEREREREIMHNPFTFPLATLYRVDKDQIK